MRRLRTVLTSTIAAAAVATAVVVTGLPSQALAAGDDWDAVLTLSATAHIKDDDRTDDIGDHTLKPRTFDLPMSDYFNWKPCQDEVVAWLELKATKGPINPHYGRMARVEGGVVLMEGISCRTHDIDSDLERFDFNLVRGQSKSLRIRVNNKERRAEDYAIVNFTVTLN